MNNLVQRVYRAFDKAPLTPEQHELYVDLDAVRGAANVVTHLSRKIRFAGSSMAQVLAGHRGSGKSTELNRLVKELQTVDPRFFVVQCTASDIDLHDVDFLDVLVEIIRQLGAQLRQRAAIEIKPGYFKDRWQRLKKLLFSDISFDSLTLDAGMGEIAVSMKASPDTRLEIRKLLEPDTGNWLDAANKVISEAVLELTKKGYAGLVIIVDNLDHMDVYMHDEIKCMTDEHLFVNRVAQMTAFDCHVVYAMPINLAYSHHARFIEKHYGGEVPVVPMTKIRTAPYFPGAASPLGFATSKHKPKKPMPSKPFKPGIDKFRELIARRIKSCNATEKQIFDSAKVRDELIMLSGGDPSELMRLVREALVTDATLPIRTSALRRVTIDGRRMFDRFLRQEHWPVIDEVRRTGRFDRTADNELAFRELLDSRAILQYVNDKVWYGINPMVEQLAPPIQPEE